MLFRSFRAIHTTRNRLMDSRSAFTIEYDQAFHAPLPVPPKTTRANLSKSVISLETKLDLDYWEVDPAWDGKTFKSAAQAVPATNPSWTAVVSQPAPATERPQRSRS